MEIEAAVAMSIGSAIVTAVCGHFIGRMDSNDRIVASREQLREAFDEELKEFVTRSEYAADQRTLRAEFRVERQEQDARHGENKTGILGNQKGIENIEKLLREMVIPRLNRDRPSNPGNRQ
jgi:hypothetical protein